MQKKVAFAPCAASTSSTAGVTSGSGPSSIVIAISRRAIALAGRRLMLSPSQAERGHRPTPVSSAWFITIMPSAHGHSDGKAATPSNAPACSPTLALTSSGARQRGAADGVSDD